MMETGRGAYDYGIDVIARKDIFGALEDRLLHQPRGLISSARIGIGGGYQFYIAHASQGRQAHPAGNFTTSDDSYSNLLLHALAISARQHSHLVDFRPRAIASALKVATIGTKIAG